MVQQVVDKDTIKKMSALAMATHLSVEVNLKNLGLDSVTPEAFYANMLLQCIFASSGIPPSRHEELFVSVGQDLNDFAQEICDRLARIAGDK